MYNCSSVSSFCMRASSGCSTNNSGILRSFLHYLKMEQQKVVDKLIQPMSQHATAVVKIALLFE